MLLEIKKTVGSNAMTTQSEISNAQAAVGVSKVHPADVDSPASNVPTPIVSESNAVSETNTVSAFHTAKAQRIASHMIDLKTGGTEITKAKVQAPTTEKHSSAVSTKLATDKNTIDKAADNKTTASKNAAATDAKDQVAPCSPAWRCVRMVCVGIVGVATMIVGLILVPLPGPGWLIVFGGLGILGTEFPWARNVCRAVKIKAKKAWNWMFRKRTKPA